jgi:hypothetical protein
MFSIMALLQKKTLRLGGMPVANHLPNSAYVQAWNSILLIACYWQAAKLQRTAEPWGL